MPALAGSARAQNRNPRAAGLIFGRDGWLFPTWDRVNQVDFQNLRPAVASVAEAMVIAARAGITLAPLVMPQRARLYADFLPANLRVSPDVARRHTTILAGLRRPDAVVVDLDAACAAHRRAQPDDTLYFRQDSHWTPSGAELAAAEMARAIREKVRLPPSPRPGTPLGAPVQRTNPFGDLVVTLGPAERARYQPEPYVIRPSRASLSPTALVEEDAADVAVVGSSFMQPRFNFQPVLSNLLERPVALHWRNLPAGPYRTLLEYVTGGGFRAARPKVIVWFFNELDMENESSSLAWSVNAMPTASFLSQLRRAVAR